MNVPLFATHPLGLKKHYYFDTVEYKGFAFTRFLTPTGWNRLVHYYDTFKESDETLREYAQCSLPPVTEYEYETEMAHREDWRQLRDEELRLELETQC
jgi:hypothetical protein